MGKHPSTGIAAIYEGAEEQPDCGGGRASVGQMGRGTAESGDHELVEPAQRRSSQQELCRSFAVRAQAAARCRRLADQSRGGRSPQSQKAISAQIAAMFE